MEFLLTVVLAAAVYANGERATERILRFGRSLAGAGGENAIHPAHQTMRGVALGVVATAITQAIFGGVGLVIAGIPFAGVLTGVMLLPSIAQVGVVPVLSSAVAWLYWNDASAGERFCSSGRFWQRPWIISYDRS